MSFGECKSLYQPLKSMVIVHFWSRDLVKSPINLLHLKSLCYVLYKFWSPMCIFNKWSHSFTKKKSTTVYFLHEKPTIWINIEGTIKLIMEDMCRLMSMFRWMTLIIPHKLNRRSGSNRAKKMKWNLMKNHIPAVSLRWHQQWCGNVWLCHMSS